LSLYLVSAEGAPWIDADGASAWPLAEAETLADLVERQGYADVEVQAA
jgi:hypothetical protein